MEPMVRVSGWSAPADSPVMVALQLSVSCREFASRSVREVGLADALGESATQLEQIAAAILDVTAYAAQQAAVSQSGHTHRKSPWVTAARTYSPGTALSHFLEGCTDYAVDHRCKVMLAAPRVALWISELFYPSPATHDALKATASASIFHGHRLLTIAINLLILPLLPLVPDEMEDRMHAHALRAIKEGLPSPYVVWVLPAGRLALWFVSTLLLGLQLTFSPTSLISLHHKSGNEQADRFLYALAVAESLQVVAWLQVEGTEALREVGRQETLGKGIRMYLRSEWNVLDLGIIIAMSSLVECSPHAHVPHSAPPLR